MPRRGWVPDRNCLSPRRRRLGILGIGPLTPEFHRPVATGHYGSTRAVPGEQNRCSMADLPPPPPPRGSVPEAGPPPSPKSRRSKGFIIAMVIAGLIVFGWILSALGIGEESRRSDTYPSNTSTYTVRYVVDGGSRQADVTYQNANGDTSQESEVTVPWDYSFTEDPGAFQYISAQRGGATGDITCSIEVNGQTVESNTSSGPYTICTASGTL